MTVIVPCHNEEGNINSTIQSILDVAPSIDVELRVIMIDDGSTDTTRDKMEELCRLYPNCTLQLNPKALGMGRSVLNSFLSIPAGSWVTVIPGDNEFSFDSIREFLPERHRYDVILGYVQNPVIRSFTRRLASHLFQKVTSSLYGFRYRYLNGMKLYRIEAFRGLEVISSGHAYVAEMLAKAILRNPRLRVGEVPYVSLGRATGSSKAVRPVSIIRALIEVFRGHRSVVRYRNEVIRGKG